MIFAAESSSIGVSGEQLLIALGVLLAGALLGAGKKLAEWSVRKLGEAIADAIGDQLEPRWTSGIRREMDAALGPIHKELQIEKGAGKWPNGSESLPSSMDAIYERQAATHTMVENLVAQIESLLVGRRPLDDPDGTPGGF